jgi:DNA mismatch repair protein MutL
MSTIAKMRTMDTDAETPRIIRVLPETVANQIAAGEVVERPASVVKELVENSLDAEATRITVSVEGGGSKLVEVEDNGYGMSRENAITALERQATSKISTSEDITQINTFGFRGEAIPSIASVSRFTLITRCKEEDSGTQLDVIGGTLENTADAGHPIGTTLRVRDLFFNLPARRKFLRAAATELSRIRQSLTAIALAHPHVAIRLKSEGKDVFRLPEGDSLDDRIRTLLGAPLARTLTAINHTENDITVTGYISRVDAPALGTPEQYVFVNHRPATAAQIQYAVREVWPVRERRPSLVLFIDLPPDAVDVNVHPAKREVRFRRGNQVINAVSTAIAKALNLFQDPTPTPSIVPVVAPTPAPTPTPPSAIPYTPLTPIPTPQAPKSITPVRPTSQQQIHFPEPPPAQFPAVSDPPARISPIIPPATPPVDAPVEKVNFAWLRVADILDSGFWLVITEQGYVTVDAGAALERICYERFIKQANQPAIQPLLIPETLELSPADADRVSRFIPELESCGFSISVLSANTFIIDALPMALAEVPPRTLIPEIAAEIDKTGVRKGIDQWRQEVAARAAASAAARTLHIKTKDAAEALLRDLSHCKMPYTTPRGRPVMILTTYRELARRFQRT